MNEQPDPNELRDLLGAYALGAVDDDERARVDDLVLHDTDARAELHQLEHAVAWLGHASPRPSDASWDAVRAEMDRDVAAGTDETDVDTAPVGPVDDTEIAPVVDLTARRARPRWQRITAVAAAVVLVVGLGLALGSVFSADDTGGTSTVALNAPNGQVAVTARMDTDGAGTIETSSLPDPPTGHEYQLWYQGAGEDEMHSVALLGTEPDGHRFHVPARAERMAISVEPEGRSAAPTTDPVAVSEPL